MTRFPRIALAVLLAGSFAVPSFAAPSTTQGPGGTTSAVAPAGTGEMAPLAGKPAVTKPASVNTGLHGAAVSGAKPAAGKPVTTKPTVAAAPVAAAPATGAPHATN